jgi:tetratricopeptide (TPR) repeat protein
MKNRAIPLFSLAPIAILAIACAGGPAPAAPAASAGAAAKPPALTEGQRLQKSQDLTDSARQLLDQGKNAEGLDKANAALEVDPENWQALSQKGRANLGKNAKGLEVLAAALKISDYPAAVYCQMGYAYRNMGNIDKSMESFSKAMELAPKDGQGFRETAWNLFYRLDDPAKAIAYWDKAVACGNNDPWIHYDRACAFEKLGDKARVQASLKLAKQAIDAGQGDDWVKRQVAEMSARYN